MRFDVLICCILAAVNAGSPPLTASGSEATYGRHSGDLADRWPVSVISRSRSERTQKEGPPIRTERLVTSSTRQLRRPMTDLFDSDVVTVNHPRVVRPSAKQNAKIVGGEDADYNKHPYQLQLAFNGAQVCGASIISSHWAVTAAHCLSRNGTRKPAFSITLRAGATFRNKGGKVYGVSRIIIHPQFNESEYDYDIALLKVKKPFRFQMKVNKIALPSADHKVSRGEMAVVSGWGYLEPDGTSSNVFQTVRLPVVKQTQCKHNYEQEELAVTNRMLCAGEPKGQRDFCEGDSGGPLVVNRKLVGIVSWSAGCAMPGLPGVFTRVSKFRDWIKDKTGV